MTRAKKFNITIAGAKDTSFLSEKHQGGTRKSTSSLSKKQTGGAGKDNFYKLANEVFSSFPLLERILDFVIHDGSKEPYPPTLRSLRLVHKSWLQITTKILQRTREPLYKFALSYDQDNGRLLNKFVNSVTFSSRAEDLNVPTFRLKTEEESFCQINYASLSNCFVHCGKGIVELDISIPVDIGSLTCIFPSFSFPSLRKLSFKYGIGRNLLLKSSQNKQDQFQLAVVKFTNISHYLNALLNASKGLTDCYIGGSPTRQSISLAPYGCQYLSLPATLEKMELTCEMTRADFQLLLRNNLPNLVELSLFIPENPPLPDEVLSSVLEKFRTTLRVLKMNGHYYPGPPRHITLLCPRMSMSNLLELHLESIHCELEPELCSVQSYFPKVKSMTLHNQTIYMLDKWTEKSEFATVESLSVRVVNDSFGEKDRDHWISLTEDRIQRVLITFPNIQHLQLTVGGKETCGLKLLFIEMTGLKTLTLTVTGRALEFSLDFWDALWIGGTEEFIAGLRVSPRMWDNVKIQNENLLSIKHMSNLNTLKIFHGHYLYNSSPPNNIVNPLLSELTFRYVFLKMSNLKNLHFNENGFSISRKMRERWMKRGRTLVCSPTPRL